MESLNMHEMQIDYDLLGIHHPVSTVTTFYHSYHISSPLLFFFFGGGSISNDLRIYLQTYMKKITLIPLSYQTQLKVIPYDISPNTWSLFNCSPWLSKKNVFFTVGYYGPHIVFDGRAS